ncbi:hypothetical protein COLU111180_06175 [Cohnella lubricantis]|uniref:Uncharacterized protein n=1 Tax=Cohnella lubricantis TaxID=2163172 RepID=A0A841TBY3_9BACL|nr:hypothetical protein [Cohnella lubricantis]MBB6677535.1 hypothetical protein [Cohnella lubricantis]MBP2116579.1 hypothetical protein [Cohnella lubricantis]
MKRIDAIEYRLEYLGAQAEEDTQWLIAKLEKMERVLSAALPYISDEAARAAVKQLLAELEE